MIERAAADRWVVDPGVLRVLRTIHGDDRYSDDDDPDEDELPDVAGRAVRAWLATTGGEGSSRP
jgi:hypothetical protein